MKKPSVCLVGLENLPVLSESYNSYRVGGEQVQQTLIAKALIRRGYNVSMVIGDYGQMDGAIWDGIVTYKAYKFDSGMPVVRFIHPRWTGLWSALKRASADIYYTSCAGMHVGLMALFCRKFGKKLIFRVASDSDCEPRNYLVRYWRDKKLYEYGLRRADSILVQSGKQQHSLYRNHGLGSKVARMLVSAPSTYLPFEGRDIEVLWVSNIRQVKRADLYLELAQQLPKHEFVLVGGSLPDSRSLYDQICKAAESQTNVKFLGQVSYHDSSSLFARARLFVNTSDIEGFPNSFLQSWIHGTPVVSFLDPDRIIQRNGLGVVANCVSEMASAVAELLCDTSSWQSASERCKKYMQTFYGDDCVLSPYLSEIHRLCGIPVELPDSM